MMTRLRRSFCRVPARADRVMIKGEWRVEDGRAVGVDETDLMRRHVLLPAAYANGQAYKAELVHQRIQNLRGFRRAMLRPHVRRGFCQPSVHRFAR